MSWFSRWYRRSSSEDDEDASGTQAPDEQTNTGERFLEGRRYRQDIPYAFPKDLGEVNRLDFQHYLLNQAIKTNHVAHISPQNTTNILDLGCGTGRWALEMSAEFPQAQIIGLDIETPLISPEALNANCAFVQGNILLRLPFPDNSFMYIHQRFLTPAIPAEIWPQELAEIVRITAPNGWIELIEMLPRVEPMGVAGKQMNDWIEQFCQSRRINPAIAESLTTLLDENPSLVEKNVYYYDLPVGEWGGREGSLLAKSHLAAYLGIKPIYIDELHIEANEFDRVLATMQQEWDAMHAHSRCYFAIAQKTSLPESQPPKQTKRYSW
jgi:Methylase involved in ubiquinone/menaquinone biosynthesis